MTLDFERELGAYIAHGGDDPVNHLLSLGARAAGADAICLYWRLREQIVSPRLEGGDERVRRVLQQQVRRELWPWLMRQTPSGKQVMLTPRPSPVSKLTKPLLVLPMRDAHDQVAGLLAMHLSAGNCQQLISDWQSQASIYQRLLRKQLYLWLDNDTGLPGRVAFVREAQRWCASSDKAAHRACLLTIQLDSVRQISERCGEHAARMALLDILGLLETRLRGRDLTGRTGPVTISVLLKLCSLDDSDCVATALGDTLNGYRFMWQGQSFETQINTRVESLEAQKTLAELHAVVTCAPDDRPEHSERLTPAQAGGGSTGGAADEARVLRLPQPRITHAVQPGNVIQLSNHRSFPETTRARNDFPAVALRSNAMSTALRVQPGMRVSGDPGIAFYLLRALHANQLLDINSDGNSVRHKQAWREPAIGRDQQLIAQVLDVLSADALRSKDTPLPPIVVSLNPAFLSEPTVEWILASCHLKRVPAESICISVTESGVSACLRDSLPSLRRLQRQGVALMLETSSQSPQAGRLLRHLPFRYVRLPVQLIDAAPANRFRMAVLKAQQRLARQVGADVVCGGIDSPALMQRCRSLGVDIAFGRSCGRTLPFDSAVFDHLPGSSH